MAPTVRDANTEPDLAAVLAKRVERFGDKPFLVTDDGRLSYRQFNAHSNRLAHGLAALRSLLIRQGVAGAD